jgi:hypothetical protein
MEVFDLCVAWNWPYDADFVQLLQDVCDRRGLSLLQVTPQNLEAVLTACTSQALTCRATLNRASDTDPRFSALIQWARLQGWFRINPREQEHRAADKATMHLEFISAGLHTPYTIILAPFAQDRHLPPLDLAPLDGAFAIKPANGGGGEGVIVAATSLSQVQAARQSFPEDKYLLQAHVTPIFLGERPAWFRALYCCGQVYPCWWHAGNRVYAPVTTEEECAFGLRPLRQVVRTIAQICGLDLFSTEIALTADGQFVVVDYVNDQIDLRLQSRAVDGVPDAIADDIAWRLASLVQDVRRDPQCPTTQ